MTSVTCSAQSNKAAAPQQRRGLLSSGRRLALLLLLCAAAIIISDRFIRPPQAVVNHLLQSESPVFLPLADTLSELAGIQQEWITNAERRALALKNNDAAAAASVTYEAERFVARHLSPGDERRRQVLLDLVNAFPLEPSTAKAYLLLLDPMWHPQLASRYPQWIGNLLQLASRQGAAGAASLLSAASLLEANRESALELEVLRQIRRQAPLTPANFRAMQRLAFLDPSGEAVVGLQEELSAYTRRWDAVPEQSRWFAEFLSLSKNGTVPQMRQMLGPDPIRDAFRAGAAAILADACARQGDWKQVGQLRLALVDYPMDDLELVSVALMEMSTPDVKSAAPAGPDANAIARNRWQGLVLAGRFEDAAAARLQVFAGADKSILQVAEQELLFAQGKYDQLSHVLVLEPWKGQLPPELSDAPGPVYHASLEMMPAGAQPPPADLTASAEIWISAHRMLLELRGTETREDQPLAKALNRDEDAWADESYELFFNPDRLLTFYYQFAINQRGTIFDMRLDATSPTKLNYQWDKAFNPPMDVQPIHVPGGWGLRIVIPRQPVFPEGAQAIRFNVRRMRWTSGTPPVQQAYTWAPISRMEHCPEQFGWLVLPAEGRP